MDGPDQDAFGGGVGDVAEDAEDVHVEGRHLDAAEEEETTICIVGVGQECSLVVLTAACLPGSSVRQTRSTRGFGD